MFYNVLYRSDFIERTIMKTILLTFCILETQFDIAKNICPRFTLSSTGAARRYSERLFGDYILQRVLNNGRVVYKSTTTIGVTSNYLYSIQYNDTRVNGSWLVRAILQYLVYIK